MGKTSIKRKYGWIPQHVDHRDLLYSSSKYHKRIKLPPVVDFRPQCPPVYDQGQLGSCTENGIAGAINFIQPGFMPSRLFIYYNVRAIEGTVNSDSGSNIRDGIKSVVNQGVCSEIVWPYNIDVFTMQPTADAYNDALNDLVTSYLSLQTISDIQNALANGFPVVFGMSVYESFESTQVAKTGIVPMPKKSESMLGGHCMLIVGYDIPNKRFIVRNSWGSSWAQSGYCLIPFDYIDQFASDFWCIQKDSAE